MSNDWKEGPSLGQKRKARIRNDRDRMKKTHKKVRTALREKPSGPTIVVKGVQRKRPKPRRVR